MAKVLPKLKLRCAPRFFSDWEQHLWERLQTQPIRGFDVETTGSNAYHSDRMFILTVKDSNSNSAMVWEWDVNPLNRQPLIPKKDLIDLHDLFMDRSVAWVGHNAKFDIRMVGKEINKVRHFDEVEFADQCHDTMILSHVIASNDSHSLKDLALLYCDLDDTDQDELKRATNVARDYAKKLGWAIGSLETCPQLQKSPDGGFWILDTWLPKAMYKAYPNFYEAHHFTDCHPREMCAKYNIRDVQRTIILAEGFRDIVDENDLHWGYGLQRSQLSVTHSMEQHGLPLRYDLARSEYQRLAPMQQQYEADAVEASGNPSFNIRSSKQVQAILFGTDGANLMPKKMTKNKDNPSASTDVDVLQDILRDIPTLKQRDVGMNLDRLTKFVSCLFVAKKLGTVVNSYMSAYFRMADYRIADNVVLHPHFNITGTDTTRFSSSNPNGQNVGKGKDGLPNESVLKPILKHLNLSLRKLFGPPKGYEWWSVDYKQLQLVVFAYVCGEQSMIDAFNRGMDFHDFVARKIYNIPPDGIVDEGQRRVAKNVNFGFIFGAQEAKINSLTHDIPGLYDLLKTLFPSAIAYLQKNKSFAENHGFVVLPNGTYRLQVPADKSHAATNYIVQGVEGIIVKAAMKKCHDYLASIGKGRLILNVHDELVFQFKAGEGDDHIWNLCQLMCEAGELCNVKCDVDAKFIPSGSGWNEGIGVEFTQVA